MGELKRQLWEQVDEVQMHVVAVALKRVSSLTSEQSRRWRVQRRERLGSELAEFHRSQPSAIAFKICRRLAETTVGKGRMFYNIHPPTKPSQGEWREFLAQPGPEGGMRAEQIDPQVEEYQ
eukprot:8023629-Lingulodinium_polyedra.AAC.1